MTTRRDFIKKTVAGTAALSLGSILPGFGSSRYQDILGANEKIRIGVIGVNSRGKALAQGFAKLPDCEVTYICDVDSRALEKCQAAIHTSGLTHTIASNVSTVCASIFFIVFFFFIGIPPHLYKIWFSCIQEVNRVQEIRMS